MATTKIKKFKIGQLVMVDHNKLTAQGSESLFKYLYFKKLKVVGYLNNYGGEGLSIVVKGYVDTYFPNEKEHKWDPDYIIKYKAKKNV